MCSSPGHARLNVPADLLAPALFADPQCELVMNRMTSDERRAKFGQFRRVLVAEDDASTRTRLRRTLRDWGFEVVLAQHGTEAMRVLDQQRPPELAILGRELPGIDGVELCRRIASRAIERTPYIFVLAKCNQKQDMVHALESGAAEYLTTPFEASELRARLVVAARFLDRQESLINARDRFCAQAKNDSLTGVWNRRAILEVLGRELCRSGQERSTGVLMVDLDHFKSVNDTYGHLVGDMILRETGRRLARTVRSHDFVGRYGGEEFLIVAPGTNQNELCELAERLRMAVEDIPFFTGRHEIPVTLSIGVTIAPSSERCMTSVITLADSALYQAKEFGRNCVVYSSGAGPRAA